MPPLRLSDLAGLSEADIEARIQAHLADRSNQAEAIKMLKANIRAFEQQYEMSTDLMLRKLASGELQETSAICSWVMCADTLNHVEEQKNGPIGSS